MKSRGRLPKNQNRRWKNQANLGKPIATDLIKLTKFYPAEEYHQNYHTKNPVRYNYYRHGSGRDKTVNKLWGNETGLESFRVRKNSINRMMRP